MNSACYISGGPANSGNDALIHNSIYVIFLCTQGAAICATRALDVRASNVGAGRGAGIALPAGFKLKQSFRRPIWSTGERRQLAGTSRLRMSAV